MLLSSGLDGSYALSIRVSKQRILRSDVPTTSRFSPMDMLAAASTPQPPLEREYPTR